MAAYDIYTSRDFILCQSKACTRGAFILI